MERTNALITLTAVAFCLLCVFIHTGEGIRCWDCNSKFDPRCANGAFDNNTLDTVDCNQVSHSHLKADPAKYCRKVVQYVEGTERTVRGCGWLNDTRADRYGGCYSRTGTKDVMVTFCSCNSDKCNPAARPSLATGHALLLMASSIMAAVAYAF